MFSSNTSQVSAVTQAEAVDFDGTNDYLRRTSDLTGNTTSKTFTFSAWIWQGDTATNYFYVVSDGTNQRFVVRVVSGTLSVEGTNNSNAVILTVTAPLVAVSRTATFYHVLISMDMANAANRSIYINDVAQTLTATTYTNAAIPFNQVDHVIAGTQGGSAGDKGRLSNVFLDYTYRDMSVTANRRLFVTADLKPAAGQSALNPIMYLPMSDPTTVATNSGTGGNFTLTGTIARSGRGPNQYNAPYSDLNGSTQYLTKSTNLTGAAASTTFTMSFVINGDVTSEGTIFHVRTASATRFIVACSLGASSNYIRIVGLNSAGTIVLDATTQTVMVVNRNYVVTCSIDLSNSSNRGIYVNGELQNATWTTYTNSAIDFAPSTTPSLFVGSTNTGSSFFNGRLGALWFNTSYIDLSVASNLAKFVSGTGINAAPADLGATGNTPTGSTPLLYLPMYGNNAGKNYGTGGDFTVTAGPYTGARGPNEFWGNKAAFDGTTGCLVRTSVLAGLTTSKTFSASFYVSPNNFTAGIGRIFIMRKAGSLRIYINYQQTTGTMQLLAYNSTTTQILSASVTTALTAGAGNYVQLSVDLANASNRSVYINGVAASVTWSVYTNDFIELNGEASQIGGTPSGSFIDGKLAEFYFTTDYIDFTQEANRLKFRDCFGNPTDLPSAITALSVPNPAIYMRFPPTSFGANSGTGGDFTVNGTITDGGQL